MVKLFNALPSKLKEVTAPRRVRFELDPPTRKPFPDHAPPILKAFAPIVILSPAAARFKVPLTFILPAIVITLVPLTARSPSNVKLPEV